MDTEESRITKSNEDILNFVKHDLGLEDEDDISKVAEALKDLVAEGASSEEADLSVDQAQLGSIYFPVKAFLWDVATELCLLIIIIKVPDPGKNPYILAAPILIKILTKLRQHSHWFSEESMESRCYLAVVRARKLTSHDPTELEIAKELSITEDAPEFAKMTKSLDKLVSTGLLELNNDTYRVAL